MTVADVLASLAKKYPEKYGFLAGGAPAPFAPKPPPVHRHRDPAHTVNGNRLPPVPDKGPGTELRKLLQELGLAPHRVADATTGFLR